LIIDVLVLNTDGTQKFEKREVPDDWFEDKSAQQTAE